MEGMTEDDSAARLDEWWQALTDDQRAQFRNLKVGDSFPREHLSPYSRASLVAGSQSGGQQGTDLRVNGRLGGFLAKERGEQE